ncbi:MAG: HU family DNA-binding protein [Candidatus Latescibacterota bacterium]
MTKADITGKISESTGMTKTDVGLVVNEVLDSISEALAKGKRIEIRGFGVFKVVRRAPRTARNPRTNEVVQIGERKAPVFVPSRILRAHVEK